MCCGFLEFQTILTVSFVNLPVELVSIHLSCNERKSLQLYVLNWCISIHLFSNKKKQYKLNTLNNQLLHANKKMSI